MVICNKCHTRMSKRRLKFHKRGCVGEGTKGHDHFIECRSVWKLKKDVINQRKR